MTTSKTAVFHQHGSPLELVEIVIPALHPNEILVRNELTTLCRSDLTTYSGKRFEPTPTILGHEIIGRIAAFGPETTRLDLRGERLQTGDRVTWAIFASDPASAMAVRGMPQKSPDRFKYGHQQLTDESSLHGGLSQYTILRPHTPIIKILESVPLQVAATINCAVATVAGALRTAGELSGRTVLVSGAGMLGVLACAMAHRSGAARVGAMDIEPSRLEIARKFGADFTVQAPRGIESSQAIEWGDIDPIDIVIEMSGVPLAIEKTIGKLAIGGTAVLIGATYPARRIEIDAENVVRNLLSIRGLHNYNIDHFRTAVAFIERYHAELPICDLIHDHFTLDEVNEAFEYGVKTNPFRVGVHL